MPDTGPPPTSSARIAGSITYALELELRQLLGVRFVTFSVRGEDVVVELLVDAGTDADALGADARAVVLGHLDGPVVIEVGDVDARTVPADDGRVRVLPAAPATGRRAVRIHLSHRERRVAIDVPADDPVRAATGVLDGLRRLGLRVDHEVVGAHGLAEELGAGTLVLLRDSHSGAVRRGLACGRDGAESTARAVLNALNRHLQVTASGGPGSPQSSGDPGTSRPSGDGDS